MHLKAAAQLRRNSGQWAAYKSSGHCVVLAGPGSGKTKTLVTKVARLVAEEVQEPRGVACITFNNECARELENRLEAIGIDAGRRVFVGTVHSFSLTQIVIPYAKSARLHLPENFCIATKAESREALLRAVNRSNISINGMDKVEWKMNGYRRSILNRNSDAWKRTNPKLAYLVETYEEELRAVGRIDFDDMPLLAVRALRENEWLKQALYAKYPVLVIDEYQDLGRALHRMVMGLCFSAGMRLFAVGDADQSIYGFLGARAEFLQQLSAREDVETVYLRLNYRSGQRIVRASSYALGEDRDYESAHGMEEGTIYFHSQYGDYPQQAHYLFSTLLPEVEYRHSSLRLGDIAVLYSAAWIGDAVFEAAQDHSIPTLRNDKKSIYPRNSRLMRWIEMCAEWCCIGWNTGSPRFSRIVNEGLRLFADTILTDDDHLKFQTQMIRVLWNRRDGDIRVREWINDLWRLFLEDYISKCRTLQDEEGHLRNFLELTAKGRDCADMVLGELAGQGGGKDCITLSTLHSSKGREYRVVVMFGMDRGRIPRYNVQRREIVEARRLFYVGFTRAKKELHIMHSINAASPFAQEVKQRLDSER